MSPVNGDLFLYTPIGMLSPHFSDMSEEQFCNLPMTTNAVESHNRLSKIDKPEILRVAMLTTYKIDMSVALEHMARCDGMQTSYEDTNEEAKGRKGRKQKRRAVMKDLRTEVHILMPWIKVHTVMHTLV